MTFQNSVPEMAGSVVRHFDLQDCMLCGKLAALPIFPCSELEES
jgi:hypothetical protein